MTNASLPENNMTNDIERNRADDLLQINHLVHHLLVIGLVISTILMAAGLVIMLCTHSDFPTALVGINQIIPAMLGFNPAGYMTLGLLVLIATPIVRVLGSIIGFLVEKDWRYAAVSGVVLLIVLCSIYFGRG